MVAGDLLSSTTNVLGLAVGWLLLRVKMVQWIRKLCLTLTLSGVVKRAGGKEGGVERTRKRRYGGGERWR